jgi:hypothetical protein
VKQTTSCDPLLETSLNTALAAVKAPPLRPLHESQAHPELSFPSLDSKFSTSSPSWTFSQATCFSCSSDTIERGRVLLVLHMCVHLRTVWFCFSFYVTRRVMGVFLNRALFILFSIK